MYCPLCHRNSFCPQWLGGVWSEKCVLTATHMTVSRPLKVYSQAMIAFYANTSLPILTNYIYYISIQKRLKRSLQCWEWCPNLTRSREPRAINHYSGHEPLSCIRNGEVHCADGNKACLAKRTICLSLCLYLPPRFSSPRYPYMNEGQTAPECSCDCDTVDGKHVLSGVSIRGSVPSVELQTIHRFS